MRGGSYRTDDASVATGKWQIGQPRSKLWSICSGKNHNMLFQCGILYITFLFSSMMVILCGI